MDYDVVVVGGGRAGAATGGALAAAGCRTLIVDRPGRRRLGESLVPAARTLLSELGAWERFQGDGHLPCYGDASAWGSATVETADFIRSPYGHGWHLDGARFDAALLAAAAAAGAAVRRDTAVAGVDLDGGRGARVHLGSEAGGEAAEEVRCRFVVDAGGRRSRVARRLGGRRLVDDRLVAFEARFGGDAASTAGDRDALNFVEAVAEGWWYTARVPAGGVVQRVVAFFTDPGAPWAGRAATRAGFLDLLAAASQVRERLADHGWTLAEGPLATDASSARLDRLAGDGWLAAGDAALAFDPLSSQGIFTALYGGIKAARAIVAHLGGDAGALPGFDRDLTAVYDHYLSDRQSIYQAERRWPESAFWRQRLRPAAASAAGSAGIAGAGAGGERT